MSSKDDFKIVDIILLILRGVVLIEVVDSDCLVRSVPVDRARARSSASATILTMVKYQF